jgi:hypothetical protein
MAQAIGGRCVGIAEPITEMGVSPSMTDEIDEFLEALKESTVCEDSPYTKRLWVVAPANLPYYLSWKCREPRFECTATYSHHMLVYGAMWESVDNKVYENGWDELYIDKLSYLEDEFRYLTRLYG